MSSMRLLKAKIVDDFYNKWIDYVVKDENISYDKVKEYYDKNNEIRDLAKRISGKVVTIIEYDYGYDNSGNKIEPDYFEYEDDDIVIPKELFTVLEVIDEVFNRCKYESKLRIMKEILNTLLKENLKEYTKIKMVYNIPDDGDIEINVIIANNIYKLNSKEIKKDREIIYLFEDAMKILMKEYAHTQILNCILERKEFTKVEKFKLFLKIIDSVKYYLFYEKFKKDKDVFEINKLFCKELEKMYLYEFLYGKDVI